MNAELQVAKDGLVDMLTSVLSNDKVDDIVRI